MNLYKIQKSTLTEMADALREVTGMTREVGVLEMAEILRGLSTADAVLPSDGVAFSEVPTEGDPQYRVGQNWLASVVKLTHKMSGTSHDLTKEDIVYWLGRVVYMPQGWAETLISWPNEFDAGSEGYGKMPNVKKGYGTGLFPADGFDMTSTMTGSVVSPAKGYAVGAPLSGLAWSSTAT